jgi:hypothetical protein
MEETRLALPPLVNNTQRHPVLHLTRPQQGLETSLHVDVTERAASKSCSVLDKLCRGKIREKALAEMSDADQDDVLEANGG